MAHLHSFGFAFGSWYGTAVDEVSGRGTVFPNIPNRCSSLSPSDAVYVKVSPRLAALFQYLQVRHDQYASV